MPPLLAGPRPRSAHRAAGAGLRRHLCRQIADPTHPGRELGGQSVRPWTGPNASTISRARRRLHAPLTGPRRADHSWQKEGLDPPRRSHLDRLGHRQPGEEGCILEAPRQPVAGPGVWRPASDLVAEQSY